jgi:hypothetical protein
VRLQEVVSPLADPASAANSRRQPFAYSPDAYRRGGLRRERHKRLLAAREEDRTGRAQIVDERLLVLFTGNERRPAWKLFGPVQVAAGDGRQSRLRHPADQLLPVEKLHPIEEAPQLPPPPREVARRERDRRGWPSIVRVRGQNRGAGGASLLHRRGRPVVHRDEAAQPDGDSVSSKVRLGSLNVSSRPGTSGSP